MKHRRIDCLDPALRRLPNRDPPCPRCCRRERNWRRPSRSPGPLEGHHYCSATIGPQRQALPWPRQTRPPRHLLLPARPRGALSTAEPALITIHVRCPSYQGRLPNHVVDADGSRLLSPTETKRARLTMLFVSGAPLEKLRSSAAHGWDFPWSRRPPASSRRPGLLERRDGGRDGRPEPGPCRPIRRPQRECERTDVAGYLTSPLQRPSSSRWTRLSAVPTGWRGFSFLRATPDSLTAGAEGRRRGRWVPARIRRHDSNTTR